METTCVYVRASVWGSHTENSLFLLFQCQNHCQEERKKIYFFGAHRSNEISPNYDVNVVSSFFLLRFPFVTQKSSMWHKLETRKVFLQLGQKISHTHVCPSSAILQTQHFRHKYISLHFVTRSSGTGSHNFYLPQRTIFLITIFLIFLTKSSVLLFYINFRDNWKFL